MENLLEKSLREQDVCLQRLLEHFLQHDSILEPTNIQQKSTILLLIDNMGIQDLIVQSPGLLIGGRHDV